MRVLNPKWSHRSGRRPQAPGNREQSAAPAPSPPEPGALGREFISGEVGSAPSVDAGLRPSAPRGEREARMRNPAHPSPVRGRWKPEPRAVPGKALLRPVGLGARGQVPAAGGPLSFPAPTPRGTSGARGNRGEALCTARPAPAAPRQLFPLGFVPSYWGGGRGGRGMTFPSDSQTLHSNLPRAGTSLQGGRPPRPEARPPTARSGGSSLPEPPNTTPRSERKVTSGPLIREKAKVHPLS